MKEIYKRIQELAEEVSELEGEASSDNMSIIIGIADCNTEKATVCCSGITGGVIEMISKIMYAIYGEDEEDETERVDGRFS